MTGVTDLRTELATKLFELSARYKVRSTHRHRDLAYKRQLLLDGRYLTQTVVPEATLIRLKNLVVDAARRLRAAGQVA